MEEEMPANCSPDNTVQGRSELLTLEKEAVIVVYEVDGKQVKVEVRVTNTKRVGCWAVAIFVFEGGTMKSNLLLDPRVDIGEGLIITPGISLHLDQSNLDCYNITLDIPSTSKFKLKDYLKNQ